MAVLGAPTPKAPISPESSGLQNHTVTQENLPQVLGHLWKKTCASEYGGPGDPSTKGDLGSSGVHLTGRMAFAELNGGTALGKLPDGAKVAIKYRDRYVIAERLDIGAGGAPCSGHIRTIDLWYETARALGFPGLGEVEYIIQPTESAKIKQSEEEEKREKAENNPCNVKSGVPLIGGGVDATGNAICKIALFFRDLGKVLNFLTSSSGWVRIGKVLLGAIVVILAINQLSKLGGGPDAIGTAQRVGEATV
jgi:hypothetical protein